MQYSAKLSRELYRKTSPMSAAMVLQKAIRVYHARQKFSVLRNAAMVFQALIKRRVEVLNWKKLKQASLLTQSSNNVLLMCLLIISSYYLFAT